jgi:hypothetical protein
MTTFGTIWLVVLSLGFAVVGWFCIFRTSVLVERARKNYTKGNRFVQAYPFSNLVLKPYYPVYIRCAGIFIWLWSLVVDYLVLFHGFR